MGFISASHTALGLHHKTCPIFDHGCHFYWDSLFGNIVGQERGAAQAAGTGLVSAYTGVSDYYIWDHGREQYIEVDPLVAPVWPYDGCLYPSRTNVFNANSPATGVRGPFTAQAGLTLDTIATPTKYIVVPLAGAPPNVSRAYNISGGTRRMYILENSHATLNRSFSLLVKRTGGGIVDSTIIELGMADAADPLGANISTSVEGTVYRKISSDGWYLVSNYLQPIVGAPDVYFYAEIKNGASIYYECPQLEAFGVSTKEPTQPIATTAVANRTRERFDLYFNDSLEFYLPQCGWLGVGIAPHSSADDPNFDYPTSIMVKWAGATLGATDFHQLYISNALQEMAYWTRVGGVTQAYLDIPSSEVQQGQPIGMVATWGYRGGTPNWVMCANGVFKDSTIAAGTMPVDLDGGEIYIGSSELFGSQANCSVFHIGAGTKMLSRSDCMHLSRWFYNRAVDRNTWGVAGA